MGTLVNLRIDLNFISFLDLLRPAHSKGINGINGILTFKKKSKVK